MRAYLDKGRVSPILDNVPLFAVMVEDLGVRGARKNAEQLERGIHSEESDEDMPMGGGIFIGDSDDSDENAFCGGIRERESDT